jgi:hypothetical protein
MRKVLQVKRYVLRDTGKQDNVLPERVSVAHLVEDIWILARHVCDQKVCAGNLVVDPFKHRTYENLFIHALTIKTCILARALYSELIDVVKT